MRLDNSIAPEEHPAPRPAARFAGILRQRDFRLLWSGEFVSLLGDKFFLVALPWLILGLKGNPLTIGGIVAVGAAPRAIFILFGGVLSDTTSPRTVMLYSNLGRMAVVAVIALLTATGWVQLWMLYASSLLLGLGYAFYLPAQATMIPRLVPEDRLQAGNAVIQGTVQLSLFLGPVVAGLLIFFFPRGGTGAADVPGALGLGVVFALTALSFLFSTVTLYRIRLAPSPVGESRDARQGVFRALAEGLGHVWRDRTLRLYFVLIGAVNLALLGPISVGIPVLADTRFGEGALGYGAILSGLGLGALVGVAAGGVFRRPRGRSFAAAMLLSTALLGVALAFLGAVPSTGPAAAATFLVGVAEGYLTIEFITWLQLRTPRDELGRILSILLFVSVGLAPVSNVIAGALIGVSATWVMIGAGAMIVLVAVVAATRPAVWRLSEAGVRPAAGHAGEGPP